jgi:hypothetical protein
VSSLKAPGAASGCRSFSTLLPEAASPVWAAAKSALSSAPVPSPAPLSGSGGRFDRGDGYGGGGGWRGGPRYDDRGPPPPRWGVAHCACAPAGPAVLPCNGTPRPDVQASPVCGRAQRWLCAPGAPARRAPCASLCSPHPALTHALWLLQGPADVCGVCAGPAATHRARAGAQRFRRRRRCAPACCPLGRCSAGASVALFLQPCRARRPGLSTMHQQTCPGDRAVPPVPPHHRCAGQRRVPPLPGRLVGGRHQG